MQLTSSIILPLRSYNFAQYFETLEVKQEVKNEGRSRYMTRAMFLTYSATADGGYLDGMEAIELWESMEANPEWARDSKGKIGIQGGALRLLVHMYDDVTGASSVHKT